MASDARSAKGGQAQTIQTHEQVGREVREARFYYGEFAMIENEAWHNSLFWSNRC
jgi:hypothetical protein